MSAPRSDGPRTIKRYANRKMYDTEQSCYVTLEEVAALVRGGIDVRVIDNATKADLTEVTLAQALLDGQRKNRQPVSLAGLRTLFSQGGDLLSRNFADVARARTDVERTVERTVERLRSEAERKVGLVWSRRPDGAPLDSELAEAAADLLGLPPSEQGPPAGLGDTTDATGLAAPRAAGDDWRRWLADALGAAFRRHDDGLEAALARIDALERRLATVERQLAAGGEAPGLDALAGPGAMGATGGADGGEAVRPGGGGSRSGAATSKADDRREPRRSRSLASRVARE